MKKTIILIALALLLIVPVFAATNALTVIAGTADATPLTDTGASTSSSSPKDTTVKIKLEQWPKYLLAITTTDYDGTTNTITNTTYDNVRHFEEIPMTVDKDTWTLDQLSGQYYVTYFAYENNQNVEYTIKLNGNMKLKDTTTATSSATTSSGKQDEIRYQMTIAGISGTGSTGSGVTIYSNGTDSDRKNKTTIMKVAETNLIGWSDYKSFALTLDAYTNGTTKDTVQNNIVGNYEGTVTLTIKSYS